MLKFASTIDVKCSPNDSRIQIIVWNGVYGDPGI